MPLVVADLVLFVHTTIKMCQKYKKKYEHKEKIVMLKNIVREITLKLIKVDQELKDLNKQINLQDPENCEFYQIKETEDVIEPPKSDNNDNGEIIKSIETSKHKPQGTDISSVVIKTG